MDKPVHKSVYEPASLILAVAGFCLALSPARAAEDLSVPAGSHGNSATSATNTIDSDPLPSDPVATGGQWISLDGFRLHADCRGSGEVTILFEPGLGGSALEWQPIQLALAPRARVCVYDRGGYGSSDPAPSPRDARRLAREADQLLSELGVDGSLILVGHSFGGFIARLLAQRREEQMLALVLVDASHEEQLQRLETAGGKRMMPSGSRFVLSPQEVPDSLPEHLRQDILRDSRQHKAYASLHAEMAGFRQSARQVRISRVSVSYPVMVLRRGLDLYAGDSNGARKTAIWQELQEDLATLSPRGRVIVAENSGHHVHADEPLLLIRTLSLLIDDAESLIPTGQR